jgi:integrase
MQNNRVIDNLSATTSGPLEQLRKIDPDISEVEWAAICGYRPQLAPQQWATIRQFVVECVLALAPRSYVNAKRLMTMTTRYVAWVWAATGCDLRPDVVFTELLIHRYLDDALPDHSVIYRFDTARQLAAIADQLTSSHVARLPIPFQSERPQPYNRAELASMHSWAASLSTDLKKQNAHTLLALGGGAGLTAAEIVEVRIEDIVTSDAGVIVTVRGAHHRQVPVLTEWTRTLRRGIGARTYGTIFRAYRFVHYPPRKLQSFLTDNPAVIRPSVSRLRAGWIVGQLNANLPIAVLMEIAGFTSTQSLQPYLPYVKPQQLTDHLETITSAKVA